MWLAQRIQWATVQGSQETPPLRRFKGEQVSEREGAEGTPSAEFSVLTLLKKSSRTRPRVRESARGRASGPLFSGTSVSQPAPAVSHPRLCNLTLFDLVCSQARSGAECRPAAVFRVGRTPLRYRSVANYEHLVELNIVKVRVCLKTLRC